MFNKIKNFFQVKKPGDYLKYEIMGFILLIIIITLGMIYVPKIFGDKTKETYYDDHIDMDQNFLDSGLGISMDDDDIDNPDIDSEAADFKQRAKLSPKCKFYPKGDTKIACIDRCMNPYDNYRWGGNLCTDSICGEICNNCKKTNHCKWVKDEKTTKHVPEKINIIGLTGSDNTGNYIRLNWIAPKTPSKILRYSVIVESEDSSTNDEVRIDFVPNIKCKNCEYTVYNLRKNINYRIYIIAKNKYGSSPRSNIIDGFIESDVGDASQAIFDSTSGTYNEGIEEKTKFIQKPMSFSEMKSYRTLPESLVTKKDDKKTLEQLRDKLGIKFKKDKSIKDTSNYSNVYNIDGSINSIYQSKLGNNEFNNIVTNMVAEKIDANEIKQSYNIKVV